MRINGLYTLMDVQVLLTQISTLQEQYLRGTNAISTTSLTNERRHQKVEVIRNDIERVQRRLNREKTTKQHSAISDQALPGTSRRQSIAEISELLEPQSHNPKVSAPSKSHNSLINDPVDL